MQRIALLVAVACVAVAASAAPATAQVPGNTDWGGGEIVDKPPGRDFPGRAGDANVSLRTSVDATAVTVAGTILLPRPGGPCQVIGSGTQRLGPGGTFSVRERRTLRSRIRTDVTISGRIEGGRATGEVVGSLKSRRGRTLCKGRTTFTSIAVPDISAAPPAPAPAGTVLRGLVSGMTDAPYDIVMRVAPDGRSIARMNFSVPWKCRGFNGDESFYEDAIPVKDDGTFRVVSRYTIPYSDAIDRGSVTISGRFVMGGVVGTVTGRETSRARKGRKRVVDRCASGNRAFRAAV